MRKLVSTLSILSIFVVAGVFWQLRIIGISKTMEPSCGLVEHKHDESCGISQVLICEQEEGQTEPQLICELTEHTHTDRCYETVQVLVCTQNDATQELDESGGVPKDLTYEQGEVQDGTQSLSELEDTDSETSLEVTQEPAATHVHDESCYETRQILICDLPEHTHGDDCWLIPTEGHVHTEECYKTVYGCGLEEHEHVISCYSDVNADLETESDWTATLPAELSGIGCNDLVSVAKSQIGYTESERNYIISEDGETLKHYTRYGQWYGNPYGHWDAMFASFCLYYAGIPQSEFPYAGGGSTWVAELQTIGLYELPGSYVPHIGDVVFLNLQVAGYENHIGIISAVTDTSIETIEGDVNGQVVQASYELSDSRIIGYGRNGSLDSQSLENSEAAPEADRLITYAGLDYSVAVSLNSEAAIPETAELSVRELEQNSEEYNYYYQQTVSAMQLDTVPAFCRFFDVSFINEGTIIEPMAPVNVTITYAETLPLDEEEKCTAVHFAEEGLELLDTQIEATEEGDAVIFTQDSFSVVGTVIEGKVTLTNDNKYVFYTGDGYALGVVYNGSSYQVQSVPINIGNNGYITPLDNSLTINNISWIYNSNFGLYNTVAHGYLHLIATTPQVVSPSTAYTSTLGLGEYDSISSRVINNSVRLWKEYNNFPYGYTGKTAFMLAYSADDGNQFLSGTEFNSALTYLLTANVEEVSDELVDPGSLEVADDIRQTGCIEPKLNIVIPGTTAASTYTYVWENSTDDGATWNEVIRRKITGESYNLADDGSWLNVALDQGAETQYRVSLVAVDGATLGTPIRSNTYYVPYFDELKNGDFENPIVPLTDVPDDYQPFMANGTSGMVWKTTASDGQIEYISVAQPIYQQYSQSWHACEDAESGDQYVELNATQAGALYQDVLTVPGSTMYWQLSHRARGSYYLSGQRDTMYVVIMSTKMAEDNNITTTDNVQQVIDNPASYPGATVVTVTNDNLRWYTENGTYDVPDEQYLSRYFFVTGHTASNDVSIGNHLDNVSFSTALPPPAPDKANVVVTKKIEGLSYDDAYELLGNMAFYIYDNSGNLVKEIGVDDLGLFQDNGDGTYSASYTQQNLTPGRYIVYENTNNGIADKTGYTRTTSVAAVNGDGESSFVNGNYLQAVNAPAMGAASVTFQNSYQRATVSVTLLKKGSGGESLLAEFGLAVQGDTDWTSVGETISTVGGQATLSGLFYDTLYRLTETKAPDGYIGYAAPVYFKITAGGIVFYDETGTTVVTQPDSITVDNDPITEATITVVNQPGFVLPNTGGSGTFIFTVTGLLLAIGSIMIGCVLRRKWERRLNT